MAAMNEEQLRIRCERNATGLARLAEHLIDSRGYARGAGSFAQVIRASTRALPPDERRRFLATVADELQRTLPRPRGVSAPLPDWLQEGRY